MTISYMNVSAEITLLLLDTFVSEHTVAEWSSFAISCQTAARGDQTRYRVRYRVDADQVRAIGIPAWLIRAQYHEVIKHVLIVIMGVGNIPLSNFI